MTKSKTMEIKIPRTLNEHITGKCNMDYPEDAPEVVGAVDATYAKAIKDRRDLEKKLDADFKEQDKATKEFVKKNAGIDMKEGVQLDESTRGLKRAVDNAIDALDELFSALSSEDTDGILSEDDMGVIGEAYDILGDVSFLMDSKNITEAAVAEPPVKKTRVRDKASDLLRNQVEDDSQLLWMEVYDELSADIDDGDDSEIRRRLKAKRGERYQKVLPCADGIIVYAPSEDKLDFAKRVAAEYGVETIGPRKSKIPESAYYPWEMIFVIPT